MKILPLPAQNFMLTTSHIKVEMLKEEGHIKADCYRNTVHLEDPMRNFIPEEQFQLTSSSVTSSGNPVI